MHELEVRVAFSSSWVSEVLVRITERMIGKNVCLWSDFRPADPSEIVRPTIRISS